MISTNIDGSAANGSNQLFDLLTIVANPAVYTAKLKELQDAYDKNQALVALAGPASEIVAIREQLEVDKKKAESDAASLRAIAAKSLSDANEQAARVLNSANVDAAKILAEAKIAKEAAVGMQNDASQAMAKAVKAQSEADSLVAAMNAKIISLDDSIKAADDAKASFEALKAEVISKQQKFIASL